MQKIIKLGNKLIVIINNNTYQRENLTQDEINTIFNSDNEEDIIKIMNPEYGTKLEKYNRAINIENRVKRSNILTVKDNTIYWEEVSGLSMPLELADAIIKAEVQDNKLELETYKNFWTLMSLNTNEECRKNLFWFLNRNGLVISRCGFFVAYRNADLKFIDTDGKKVLTDHHSHTTRIKIGDMVTLPREQCDCDSKIECSRGLICSPLY